MSKFLNIVLAAIVCGVFSVGNTYAQNSEVLGLSSLKNPNSRIFAASSTLEHLKDDPNISFDKFANDVRSDNLKKRVADQLRNVEYTRLLSPYSNMSILQLLASNTKIRIDTDTNKAIITFYHPDATMTNRIANLYAREYLSLTKDQKGANQYSKLADSEKRLESVNTALNAISARISKIAETGKDMPAALQNESDEIINARERVRATISKLKAEIQAIPAAAKISTLAKMPQKPVRE